MTDGPTLPLVSERGPLATVGYWNAQDEFQGVLIREDVGLHHYVQHRWSNAGWVGVKRWIDAGIDHAGYRTAGSQRPQPRQASTVPVVRGANNAHIVRSFHYLENKAFSAALVVSPWGVRSLEESIYRRWERDEVLARYAGLATDGPELRAALLEVCGLLDHTPEERDYVLTGLTGVEPAEVGPEGVQVVGQRVLDALACDA